MHISCDQKELLDNINIVQKCVSSRTTSPILECILLKADREGFKLIANDLEQSIETSYIEGADIYNIGDVALDAKMFFDFVRSMKGRVDIETDENFVTTLKSGRVKVTIAGLDGNEFPLPKQIENGSPISIKGKDLKSMIKQTIFSIAQVDYRPILTGELFEFTGQRFNMVAVDGHRIAYRTILRDNGDDFNGKIVVPGKALNEVSRLVEDEEDAELYFNDKFIEFRLASCKLTSRLFEGDYLEYGKMFTNDYKTKITVNREFLMSCLERCLLLIAREVKKVEVILEITDGTIKISAQNSTGDVYEDAEIDFEGDELKIGFSPRYLLDICRAIDEEELTMYFISSLSPCIVKSSIGNEDFKYLVLPVKI